MNIKRTIKKFNNVMKDKERKNFGRIFFEFLSYWIDEKRVPLHYFSTFSYKKGFNYYDRYVPNYILSRICENSKIDKSEIEIFDDKLKFHKKMSEINIDQPDLIGCLKNSFFYGLVDEFKIKSFEDFESVLGKIQSDLNEEAGFIKPVRGKKGDGCFLIDFKNRDEFSERIIFKRIIEEEYLIQKRVLQHKRINQIYPNSLNTIRLITYLDNKKESYVLSCGMRFGQKGSIIDNGSKGGICVGIDLKTGKMLDKAMYLIDYGTDMYTKHPDTGYLFEGTEVPYFDQVKEICCKATKHFNNKIIGWDVAIGEEGPVLIEANINIPLRIQENLVGGYKDNKIFRLMHEELYY